MAQFRIQVFKRLGSNPREWSNTYRVDAADLDTAVTLVPSIGSMEQQLHLDNVTITRALVSDVNPATDVFATVPMNLTGSRSGGSDGAWLPIFNTMRVDISVVGGGRPSRKFYRGPILESDQQGAFLSPTVVSLLTDQLNGLIAVAETNSTPLIDPDGQEWDTAVGQSAVQMRQLHRKRKKATPSP